MQNFSENNWKMVRGILQSKGTQVIKCRDMLKLHRRAAWDPHCVILHISAVTFFLSLGL